MGKRVTRPHLRRDKWPIIWFVKTKRERRRKTTTTATKKWKIDATQVHAWNNPRWIGTVTPDSSLKQTDSDVDSPSSENLSKASLLRGFRWASRSGHCPSALSRRVKLSDACREERQPWSRRNPNPKFNDKIRRLFSRLESRSLSELIRQIATRHRQKRSSESVNPSTRFWESRSRESRRPYSEGKFHPCYANKFGELLARPSRNTWHDIVLSLRLLLLLRSVLRLLCAVLIAGTVSCSRSGVHRTAYA